MMLAELRAAAARRAANASVAPPASSTADASATATSSGEAATESASADGKLPQEATDDASAAVEEEPPSAKYKRMLRAGVPLPSVLRKMGEEAFDVALFDGEQELNTADVEMFYRPAFERATKPRAVAASEEDATAAAATTVRKKVHLAVIATSKTTLSVVDEQGETRMWTRDCGVFADTEVTPATFNDFNTLFTQLRTTTRAAQGASSGRVPTTKVLIDKVRAQNIAILLVGMKLSLDEWRQCVLNLTFNIHLSDTLKMLLISWPTSAEERAIQAFDDDDAKLGRAEEFFVGLSDIPRLKEKFECLQFRLLFSTRVYELRESMLLVVRGINQLIEKEKFAAVMQHIFRLCCVLNDGEGASYTKSNAKGFRMSSLTQLLCTQTFDPATSVLRAMVRAIERDDPRLGTFARELTLLKKCAAVSVEALRFELVSLESGYNKLVKEMENAAMLDSLVTTQKPYLEEDLRSFNEIINSFAAEAELELQGLRVNLRELNDACRRLNYYLEEPEDTLFAEVITHIAVFVEAYVAERAKLLSPANEDALIRSSASEISVEIFFSPPASQTSDSSPFDSDDQF